MRWQPCVQLNPPIGYYLAPAAAPAAPSLKLSRSPARYQVRYRRWWSRRAFEPIYRTNNAATSIDLSPPRPWTANNDRWPNHPDQMSTPLDWPDWYR